jgi:hypothetical protein
MVFKKLITACAAAALVASPIAAQAAAPLSVVGSESARAAASVDGENDLRRGGPLLWIGIAAAVLLILWATDTWPFDDDDPDSP